MFDLTGRIALVTGAGQGVGAGIARSLAGQGALVVVNDLYEERAVATVEQIGTAGGEAVTCPFDVTDYDAVRTAFDRARSEVGAVDILVNNAGIPAQGFPQVPFRDSTPALWRRFIELNLFGVIHCTHAALGPMVERGWGRIITISSEAGRYGTAINIALYGAGKAGAVGLMRHIALEVARSGVTANCLSLGLMDNNDSEWTKKIAARVPRGRLGSPGDVGAACVFLASDEAEWITGQVLPVNGGTAT